MCVFSDWAWRTRACSRAASSAASWASRKALSEALASMAKTPPPGMRTLTSGRRRPSSVSRLNCSSKSKRLVRPAASSTLRRVCSPQRPCTPAPRRRAADSLRASPCVSIEARIRASICSFSPPACSARSFSSSETFSWKAFSVSATGLSWASMRSRATRSWAWKVSVARATSCSATAWADWADWALMNSAVSRRLSSIRTMRCSAAASAAFAACQPRNAQTRPPARTSDVRARARTRVFMLRS